jgi:hypothetical protein
MNTSRRDFIKKIGISGLSAISLPKIISATNSMERSQDSDKSNCSKISGNISYRFC